VKARPALLAAALVVVGVVMALVSGAGSAPASIPDRAAAVASGLRCPVCDNLSVADSPSALAGEMRREIERRLRAGETDEQVRAFFVERYGRWVLLVPDRSGLNLLPWVFPGVALMLGAGWWWWVVAARRRREPSPADPPDRPSEADRRRIRQELEALEDAP
jgi:cytochrome c-type biogenesis protein CcmH